MSSHPDDPVSWRVLTDGALPGAINMARDQALAERLKPGTGSVRFYGWTPPALSLGRNEPVADAYRQFLSARPEIDLVRRPTGGRAVLHDRELTYSVVVPVRAFGGPRRAYRRINDGLVAGLIRMGVRARTASGRALPPGAGPCFLEPAEGEVMVAGRKVIGSAQVRIGSALLQHGSLLLETDQSALFSNWQPNGARPITLAEITGKAPEWTHLVDALTVGLQRAFGGRWSRNRMTKHERTLADKLEIRYRSSAWTWRR